MVDQRKVPFMFVNDGNQVPEGYGKRLKQNVSELGVVRTLSALASRMGLASLAGLQFGGKRDLYGVFGYKNDVNSSDFLLKYIR